MPRIGSTDAIEVWANQHKDKKLYIVLVRYESNSIPASLLLDGSVIPDSNRHLHFL
jgi:sucrose-phosphate synthase